MSLASISVAARLFAVTLSRTATISVGVV